MNWGNACREKGLHRCFFNLSFDLFDAVFLFGHGRLVFELA